MDNALHIVDTHICESDEGRREGENEERSQNKGLQPPMKRFWEITFASLSAIKIYKCWNFSSLTPEVILIHKMHFKCNQFNTFISSITFCKIPCFFL